mgnify:CR=1 FL=1
MQVRQRAHMPTTRCCTQRRIGLVVVVMGNEAGRHMPMATDMNRTRGTTEACYGTSKPNEV